MNTSSSHSNSLDKRLRKSAKRLFLWTGLWLISTAALAFGPKLIWDFNSTITWVMIASNLFFGINMLLANKHHFDDMDEMQRKIHFNAMGVSLGLTMILGCLYGLLEPAGILAETPPPSNLLFVMGISYIVTVYINFRKYS